MTHDRTPRHCQSQPVYLHAGVWFQLTEPDSATVAWASYESDIHNGYPHRPEAAAAIQAEIDNDTVPDEVWADGEAAFLEEQGEAQEVD